MPRRSTAPVPVAISSVDDTSPEVTQSVYWLAMLDVFNKLHSRPQSLACRVIKSLPRIITANNEIGKQDPGNRAMRHAHSRITGGNEYIVIIKRVLPNERQTVDWLHNLTGPTKLDFSHRG